MLRLNMNNFQNILILFYLLEKQQDSLLKMKKKSFVLKFDLYFPKKIKILLVILLIKNCINFSLIKLGINFIQFYVSLLQVLNLENVLENFQLCFLNVQLIDSFLGQKKPQLMFQVLLSMIQNSRQIHHQKPNKLYVDILEQCIGWLLMYVNNISKE